MSLELLPDIIFILDRMSLLEMGLKWLPPVEHLGALLDPVGAGFMTQPCYDLMMLRVFMPFPVVLAAKGLETSFEGAAVGASMTLLMFPVVPLSGSDSTTEGGFLILQITLPVHLLGTKFTCHQPSL